MFAADTCKASFDTNASASNLGNNTIPLHPPRDSILHLLNQKTALSRYDPGDSKKQKQSKRVVYYLKYPRFPLRPNDRPSNEPYRV